MHSIKNRSATIMKRILFIGSIPPPITGQSLACEIFLHELRKKYIVHVININKNNLKSGKFENYRFLAILSLVYKSWKHARTSDAIYFTISESILGNLKDLFIFLVTWRILPKSAVHLHGGAGMKRLLANPRSPLRIINKFFLSRIGNVIVLGNRLKPIYNGVVDYKKIEIVQNFSEKEFSASSNEIDCKFSNFENLRILYLSNMIPEKGYIYLKNAVQNINNILNKKLYLDFAGNFITEEDKINFLNSISDDPYVNYHGVVHGEIKRQLLIRSHILALPTFYPYEGQPISILEAYAAGCAVLTTDHSGIFDIFTPTLNGWQVDKASQKSIESAIIYCLANKAEVKKVGQFNAASARENFSTERYNNELLNIMENLLRD
jgi:glycosyltransferase involved in cell wall biosynthesis